MSLARRKGCHPEGPGQAWEVGMRKPHEVEKGWVQGPAPGLGQSQAQVQNGRRMNWEQLWGGLGGTGWREPQPDPAMCARSPEGQPYPGLHQSNMTSRSREVILPLYSTSVRPHLESCIQLWSPQHRKGMDLLERRQRRPQKWSEGWSTSPVRKGRESWGCSAWRRLQGELIAPFQYLKGACRKDGENLLSTACCDGE